MIDHLKLTSKMAIEGLCNCSLNNDLKLTGLTHLSQCSSSLKASINSGLLDDSALFKNVFGYNVNFFYIIEKIENDTVTSYERGIASIYKQNDNTYLDRKLSFVIGQNSVLATVNSSGKPIEFGPLNNNLIIYSTLPPTYFECLSPSHCVLTSSEGCIPQPVVLHNDTFLGRLDNGIEDISFSDSRLIDKIINLITKFTKQLKLKTSKLSLKRIETEILDLVPSSNPQAKIGTLVYDKETNELKVYDGKYWKALMFKESFSENS